MELECQECCTKWEHKKREDDTLGFIPKVCPSCALAMFKLDMEHARINDKTRIFKMGPEWKAKVYNAANRLEEGKDFLFVELLIPKRKESISIAVRKKAGDSDEFLVWIGDKQLVVRLGNEHDSGDFEDGIVVSSHDPLESLD